MTFKCPSCKTEYSKQIKCLFCEILTEEKCIGCGETEESCNCKK